MHEMGISVAAEAAYAQWSIILYKVSNAGNFESLELHSRPRHPFCDMRERECIKNNWIVRAV